MPFEAVDDKDLATIRDQLEAAVRDRGLPLSEIAVKLDAEAGLLEVAAKLLSDPLLNDSGNAAHRTTTLAVRLFCDSEDTGREALWGRIRYSVSRDHANFFPVPAEYGDDVAIEFGWQFDRETLKSGAAEVRDRGSLHYVSVLPNDQLVGFVECCSEIGERAAS